MVKKDGGTKQRGKNKPKQKNIRLCKWTEWISLNGGPGVNPGFFVFGLNDAGNLAKETFIAVMKANLKQKSVEKLLHRDYEGQVEAKIRGESPSLRL